MLSRTWLHPYTHGCVHARTHALLRQEPFSVCCYSLTAYHRRIVLCAVTQLCLSLSDTMDYGSPDSSVHGVLRQEYWSGLPCSSPGDLPHPGIEPTSLGSPALAGGFFIISATWEALRGPECEQKSLLKRVCLMKQRDSGSRWLDSILVQPISTCKLHLYASQFSHLDNGTDKKRPTFQDCHEDCVCENRWNEHVCGAE